MAEVAFNSMVLNLEPSFKGACPSITETFPVWKRESDVSRTCFLWIGYVATQQATPDRQTKD